MNDGRRFEDNTSKEELMGKPIKDLIVDILLQTTKTNGTVTQNCKDITGLQTDMKDKIGLKLFRNLTIILGVIITVATIIQLFIK